MISKMGKRMLVMVKLIRLRILAANKMKETRHQKPNNNMLIIRQISIIMNQPRQKAKEPLPPQQTPQKHQPRLEVLFQVVPKEDSYLRL